MEDGSAGLRGRVALVTGGSRGIGRAICLALGADGARVAVASRTEPANQQVAAELGALGAEAHAVACDVTSAESVQRAVTAVSGRFGRIDILVNSAGSAESEPLARTDRGLWDRMLAVNLTGTYLCTQAVLPGMRQRGRGRVINIASTAGKVGYPYVSAYCAAKHGVVGFTRSVALEVAAHGITVNAVCPGYVETDLTVRSLERIAERTGRSIEEARRALEGASPLGRLMRPEEVAAVVCMLARDSAAAINGQAINVDGGGVVS